eukprot:12404022-Karenia_brevis.AAC.1
MRYQVGQMDYLVRTTPSSSCMAALQQFDVGIRRAYELVIGASVNDAQLAQACLPTRQGGLGLRSIVQSADAAYCSSRAAT